MAKAIHRVSTVIRAADQIATGIRRLRLQDPDGWELPPFTPGAHIDLHLPSGAIRQYSLCGDPAANTAYDIAVLRDPDGRGGSCEVHDLPVGTPLLVSLPRNLLPLVDCDHTVLIAGGIGITPFIPMIHHLLRTGKSFALHYSFRNRSTAAFVDWLEDRCPDQVVCHDTSQTGRMDIQAVLSNLSPRAHVYCCGPQTMIGDVLCLGAAMPDRIHVESFGGQGDPAQKAYDVHLHRSERVIPVVEGQTMLEALRAADVHIPASCEGGICLDCKTRYLAGTPDHRDITMVKTDRDAFLTPCVSGCVGDRIVLDL